jgi:hypothetical protein
MGVAVISATFITTLEKVLMNVADINHVKVLSKLVSYNHTMKVADSSKMLESIYQTMQHQILQKKQGSRLLTNKQSNDCLLSSG